MGPTLFISHGQRSTSANQRRTNGGSPALSGACMYNSGSVFLRGSQRSSWISDTRRTIYALLFPPNLPSYSPCMSIEHRMVRPERSRCANDLRARFYPQSSCFPAPDPGLSHGGLGKHSLARGPTADRGAVISASILPSPFSTVTVLYYLCHMAEWPDLHRCVKP